LKFVPLAAELTAKDRRLQDFGGRILADRIVQEMGPRLRNLVDSIQAGFQGDGAPVVLVTGCRRGAGCTTAALALALAAAECRSVMLLEGNWTHPGLAGGLGVVPKPGWTDSLRRGCRYEESLHHLKETQNLAFLALGHPVDEPARILTDPALGHWQVQFRLKYDLVIVEGGTVENSGVHWASWSDVALMVGDAGQKLLEAWASAWDQLEEAGAQVLGIVETFG